MITAEAAENAYQCLTSSQQAVTASLAGNVLSKVVILPIFYCVWLVIVAAANLIKVIYWKIGGVQATGKIAKDIGRQGKGIFFRFPLWHGYLVEILGEEESLKTLSEVAVLFAGTSKTYAEGDEIQVYWSTSRRSTINFTKALRNLWLYPIYILADIGIIWILATLADMLG